MKFEWDRRKAAANVKKHGVSFDEACDVLRDPDRLERLDDRFSYEEERVHVIGRSQSGILFVVALERPRTYRIISARKATRLEQKAYLAQDG